MGVHHNFQTKRISMADNDHDDDERPEDSAGAQCIHFNLLTHHRFGPTFVHQVFPDEFIPGYLPPPPPAPLVSKPTSTVEESSKRRATDNFLATAARSRLHPSFRGRRAATKYLTINVDLTPSCQNASLTLEACMIPGGTDGNDGGEDKINNKRRKLDEDDDDEEEIGSEDSDTDEEDLESLEGGVVDEEEWTLEQVRTALEPFLPPLLLVSGKPSKSSPSPFLLVPIGTQVASYTTTSTSTRDDEDGKTTSFVLTIATAAECATYHRAVQKLAYWFIDAASDIDITEGSTEWKVLYLFQKHEDQNDDDVNTNSSRSNFGFSLAGYMTLYHFCSPFRKPTAGRVVRVCQALVLPPYQRQGHGIRMLEAVFAYAATTNNTISTTSTNADKQPIVEVNCEDPAPAFQLLRTVVDYRRFVAQGRTWFTPTKTVNDNDADISTAAATIAKDKRLLFKPLRESMKLQALRLSLTTATQIQKVHEIDALQSLQQQQRQQQQGQQQQQQQQKSCGHMADALLRQYQAMVRSRLAREHADELGAGLEPDEAAVRLDELLGQELAHHEAVLRRGGDRFP
jgi:histone acetyltransferase 1